MIKLFFILIFAGLVYVGMNWEQISGQVESGISTAQDMKERAMDIKDQAEDTFEDARDKVEDTQDTVNDLKYGCF